MPMAESVSSVQFHGLTAATIRCPRCGSHRDVPLSRAQTLVENYREFAIIRRAFDERHAQCLEKTDV